MEVLLVKLFNALGLSDVFIRIVLLMHRLTGNPG
jgi:hypothetical protein